MSVSRSAAELADAVFDYVIVGAGSSGCVLANRLSADPKIQVLLIEAGPKDAHPFIHMPRGLVRIFAKPEYVWTYQADPVPGGRNDPHVWLRGKTLGGSSSINGMVYLRGQPEDYDGWEAAGARGWGWKTVLEAFRAIEDHELGASAERGAGGALHISMPRQGQELCDAFIDAAASLGAPRKPDLNAGGSVGAGYYPRTIKNGRRMSAARAFLKPALGRPNLTVVTDVTVERVQFEGKRAVGVVCQAASGRVVYRASQEVILSAGGLNSPALLQVSGVGDAGHLKSLGVEVVHHAPNVGENMREHWMLPLEYRLHGRGSTNPEYAGMRLVLNVLRYAALGQGPMTEASYEAGALFKTDPTLDRADAQLLFGPFTIDRARGFTIDRLPGAQCAGYVLRPESVGTVKITAADPKAPLHIRPNYMTAEYDQQAGLRLYRRIQAVMSQSKLAAYLKEQLSPPPSIQSDDEILDAWRQKGVAGYHAAGACRMGTDAGAVVDERLRVRGVAGLRVVDISVMPTLVSGNTNGPAMAMAWRAAQLILEDRAAAPAQLVA
jgi:choline dehydrogenase-like flavoprotein